MYLRRIKSEEKLDSQNGFIGRETRKFMSLNGSDEMENEGFELACGSGPTF